VVSVLGFGQMMAACGQKGNLYLPKPESAKTQPKAKPKVQQPAAQPEVQTGESFSVDEDIERASEAPSGGQN
jgi:predicted small lipoprotein YifL